MTSACAVIVAGGKGERMNSDIRKQYLLLGNLPILSHTLLVFDSCPLVNRIYLVIPEIDFDFCRKYILEPIYLTSEIQLVSGGKERQDSVFNGMSAITDKDDIVVIHDGVRPFVTAKLIEACIYGAEKDGGCMLGVPAVDTLKILDSDGYVLNTMQRSDVWLAQTPQAFDCKLIKKAHDHALAEGFRGTDDASLVEYLGKRVRVISGSPYNIKITNQKDMVIAGAIFQHLKRE
ncbi:MAG: 2-C-methyl-D-erythritol 4-phosphate cytidylyltransferase [Dissulfuribacterales bacterium]